MKSRKYAFTLIELIVAMGIFSLIMVMVMRVFSGAQALWRASENRTATYSDGRAAMDFVCRLVENSAALYQGDDEDASQGYFPVNTIEGDKPAILLATTEDGHKLQKGSVSSLYYTAIWRDPASDTLRISSLGDASGAAWSNVVDLRDASTVFSNITSSGETQEIIPRVIGFRVIPQRYNQDSDSWEKWSYGDKMPDMVTLEITFMESNAYNFCRDRNPNLGSKDWASDKLYGGPLASGETKEQRLAKNSKKFSRTVYLEYKK